MKELLKLAKGTARNWRDTKTWDRLPPNIRAIAPALKYWVPNTKYGNALIPWLLRQHKQGNIYPKDYYGGNEKNRRQKGLLNALSKSREWESKTDHPQHAYHSERWKMEAERYDRMIHGEPTEYDYKYQRYRPSPDYGSGTVWKLKGWANEDGNDLDLDDVANEIIAVQKDQKKRGLEPINPMQFANAAHLKQYLDKMALDKMRNSGQIVHALPNNWTIRKLNNQADADWEGRMMSNCVADYGDDLYHKTKNPYGENILSLRDPQNKPHVTWTWKLADRDHPEVGGGFLAQIYGKGNSTPRDEYKAMVRQYYESMPMNLRPRGDEWTPLSTHMDLGGEPPVDEYGLPGQAEPDYTGIVSSSWAHNPAGEEAPGLYPENVEKVVQYARQNDNTHALASAVNGHASSLATFLSERQREGEPGISAYQATLLTPWSQTLKAYQERMAQLPRPLTVPPEPSQDLLQHYASEDARPHIGANGKYCECPWGDGRPAWDDEWYNHTNWNEDDPAWAFVGSSVVSTRSVVESALPQSS